MAKLNNWLPLLLLALLWTLVVYCHLNLFPGVVLPIFWLYFSLGSAAYLSTLAGFIIFGNRDRPADIPTRIATALAVGGSVVFAMYALNKGFGNTNANIIFTPSNNVPWSGTNNPLNSTNISVPLLGLILSAVALIAHKSAADARNEAEKAKKEAEKAREDMVTINAETKVFAHAGRLLAYAQEAKLKVEDLLNEANEIVTNSSDDHEQSIAYFLRLGTTSLGRLAKFFMLLHHWIMDPQLTHTADLAGYAEILVLDLQALDRTAQATRQSMPAYEQRLRTEYWQPAGRLIENLLIFGSPSSAISTEAEKVMLKLKEVRAMLAKL